MTAKRPPEDDPGDGYFPIRTVCSLTGVNPVTLRAWERRHGLVKPRRTPSGHRLYSREDIDRINEILALLTEGVSISQVPALLRRRSSSAAQTTGGVWSAFQSRASSAIAAFEEEDLEGVFAEALAAYPAADVTAKLVLPLLKALGERWAAGEGTVAEEHFFGVYLRNKLGARFHHALRSATGPRVLASCLPGEAHEVGLLLFALAAQARGLRVVLLGANMPLKELPLAARHARCRAIVLSSSMDPPPALWREELPRLVAESPVPVCIGGRISARRRDEAQRAGAVPLGDDIEAGLRQLAALLDRATDDISPS